MRRLFRHRLLIGIVALLAAGGAGAAYAATQSGANSRQAFVNDVAKRLNVTPSKLRAAVRGAMLDRLEAAVKAGKLTQAQANRLKQRIESGPLPFLGPRGRFGPRGKFGPGRRLEIRPGGPAPGLIGAAAKYLGLSDVELLRDLAGGKTPAQIAQSKGKSVNGLEKALSAELKSRLDKLVTGGFITKAQEQRRLERLNARIAQLVNHGLPRFRPAAAGEVRPVPPGLSGPSGPPGLPPGPPGVQPPA